MNTKDEMFEMITPSEDYLNKWEYTRAFSIYSTSEFREGIEKGDNELKNLEVLQSVRIYDSLRNLTTPNGGSERDKQTILKAYKSMKEKGEEIPKPIQAYIDKALFSLISEEEEDSLGNKHIKKGKSYDVAFGVKRDTLVTDTRLDVNHPPNYIFQITDGLLNSDGASLNKVSNLVEGLEVTRCDAQQMRKQFMEQEMWRNIAYCKWRSDKLFKTGKKEVNWTKGQKKNLKRYWGWEVK